MLAKGLAIRSAEAAYKCLLKFPSQTILRSPSCASLLLCRSFQGGTWRSKAAQAQVEETPLKDFSEIPGPRCYPVIGCMPYVLTNKHFNTEDSHKMWEDLFAEYGNFVRLTVPGMPAFVATTNPDHVETYMKSTLQNPVRLAFKSLKAVRDTAPNNYFNKKAGLLPENGEEWWRLRSRVQAPLMKPKNVAMYLPKVDEVTLTFMDRIDQLQSEHADGRVPDNFLGELYKWSLECVGLVALNKQLGCLNPDLKEDSTPALMIKYTNQIFNALHITETVSQMWKIYRTKAYVDLETAHNEFLKVASSSIDEARRSLEEARRKGDPNTKLSILDTFLQTEGLSESDVATMILDMLFAGVDTTSHTLAQTLYLLARNPQSQRKLQAEIEAVMGDATTLLPEHISQMKYLANVVKESLRLYPLTLGNARILTENMALAGYKIPKGTLVLSYSTKITHSEEHFQRAKEFIPERWDRSRPLGEIHPFASLPFSHGKRLCIGKRIAEQEIYNFLIRALQRYNVTFESQEELEVKVHFVTKPVSPLRFKFHAR